MPLPSANSGSISVSPDSDLRFGGKVSFNYGGTGKLKNPRIYVEAHNGEGALIYGEAGGAGDFFTLGGGSSIWVEQGGGAADCVATLFYFKTGNHEWNGAGQQEYVRLASVEFDAAG